MFSSIKWRLVLVNFILVLIAMLMVGFGIMGRLETQQLDSVKDSAIEDLRALSQTGSAFRFPRWEEEDRELQTAVDNWQLPKDRNLYVIANRDEPRILASSVSISEEWKHAAALAYQDLSPSLILSAFSGEDGLELQELGDGHRVMHIIHPVMDDVGAVRGVLYMVAGLDQVDETLRQAGIIITRATFIAILVIILLGYLIAISITGPIRDVTKKAEEMAQGNFDQRVEVKSDDEIGQLGSMFNYLTQELNVTIGRIDLERHKLDTIFHYMAEGVLAIDKHQRLIQANPFAMRVLRIPETAIDQPAPKLWEKLGLPLKDGEPQLARGERGMTIDSRELNVKYAPYRNEYGKWEGLIIVLQDMTKERRLDAMRKDFVANVSHELKTPITTIKTYVETLTDVDLSDEERRHFLQVIADETERMNHLVQDLLALSNLDYGQYQPDVEPQNMAEIVRHALLRLEHMRQERGHHVTFTPNQVPLVRTHRDTVERAVLNLISNAMKYTDPGGEITIDLKTKDDDLILTVQDNGMGIPLEDQERIFERFYRVEKGRSRAMGGTGLGLAIARESVRALGGDITLASTLGRGTTVELSLPLGEDVTAH